MGAIATDASPVNAGTVPVFDANDPTTWPVMLTAAETAKIRRRNLSEIYGEFRAGKSPHRVLKDGSRYFVPRASLVAWMSGEDGAS